MGKQKTNSMRKKSNIASYSKCTINGYIRRKGYAVKTTPLPLRRKITRQQSKKRVAFDNKTSPKGKSTSQKLRIAKMDKTILNAQEGKFLLM